MYAVCTIATVILIFEHPFSVSIILYNVHRECDTCALKRGLSHAVGLECLSKASHTLGRCAAVESVCVCV